MSISLPADVPKAAEWVASDQHPLDTSITKTRLFKYIENFTTKSWKFSDKKSDIFHISDQNIDCGYSLEPPHRGGSNEYHNLFFCEKLWKIMYTPVNPSFRIKSGV